MVGRTVRTLIFAAAVLAIARPRAARADDTAPSAARLLVPPRLVTPVDAPYPAGAEGDAAVTLAVVVGTTGDVQEVRVLEGIEPFASVAADSVRGARFEPATREGKAISAIVRFRVDFAKPLPPRTTTTRAPPIRSRAPRSVNSRVPSAIRSARSR